MTIHNYVQYRCNANLRYGRMQGKRSRLSYNSVYTKIDIKRRVARWQPVFKENIGYILNESQYWLGNA